MSAKNLLLYSFLLLFTLVYTGCDDDDPPPPPEQEVITDVELTLTPQGGGDVVTFTFQDRDGDGGNAPTIVGGTLAANTVYDASVSFFDRSDPNDEEDITEEVEEEDDEHQVFYQTAGFANITVTYEDQDGDGNPLGLLTTMTTGGVGGGTLTVILLHEPNKDAAGVADGDPANAGGETDVEVAFPVTIE